MQNAEGKRGRVDLLHSAFSILPSAFKSHRFAFALLLLVAASLFAGLLLRGEVPVVRDHSDYFQPLRWFTAGELRAGRLPLWNPYNGSGEGWLANPQTGVFYPPAWIFVLLPFTQAFVLYLLLHVTLLGWGAYLLFARTVSRGAAMVGAVAVMLAGPVLSLLDVQNNLTTFAWIPLALCCAAARRPIAGGITLAMAFLAGEPFFAAVAALLFVLVSRRMRDIAVAAIVAFGISAVQLLPFLELVRASDRASGTMTAKDILRDSMPLRDWLRIAVPTRLDASLYDPHLGQHFIPVVYAGIAVLVLAAIGLVVSRHRRIALAWLGLMIAAALIAAGPELLTRLPLTLFRYPARLVPFAALGIAALAALGWDRIRPEKRWADLIVILVLIADLAPRTAPLLRGGAFTTRRVPYDASVGRDAKIVRIGNPSPLHRNWWMVGYLNLFDRRHDLFTPAPVVDSRYFGVYSDVLHSPNQMLLAFLPVGWILSDRALPMDVVQRGPGVALYRRRQVHPMAALWTRARCTPAADDALEAIAKKRAYDALYLPCSDPRTAIDAPELEVIPAAFTLTTSRATMHVDAPRNAIAVLAQRDAPGWRVTVDGKPSAKLLANGIFRAVAVPSGRHEIVWTYRPPSLLLGAVMTFVTCFALQLHVFVKGRAKRKNFSVSLEPQ